MRVTGASSVTNVDPYGEAALEETKLVKRDCQSSKDAGTAVGVEHLWYGSRVPIGGHFNFVFNIFFPI